MAIACSGGSLKPDGGGDAVSPDAGPAATLQNMLLGAWSFEGDGKDHSGQNLDLTVEGLSFPAGKFGKGVQFTGENGSPIAHRTVNDTALDLMTGDFTVSSWVNFARTSSPQFVMVKGYINEKGWFTGWAQSRWALGYPADKGGTLPDPNGSPAPGVFHHLLMERNADSVNLYVDEKFLGGISVPDRAAPGDCAFQVGGYSPGGVGGGQNVVDGIVDDVAIWHRVLTSDERAYLTTHAVP
jgi:hypothetical protein